MNQLAKGLTTKDKKLRKSILDDLESIKWYLWHGNIYRALQRIEYLLDDFCVLGEDETKPCPVALKLYKIMEEFKTYIRNNE